MEYKTFFKASCTNNTCSGEICFAATTLKDYLSLSNREKHVAYFGLYENRREQKIENRRPNKHFL